MTQSTISIRLEEVVQVGNRYTAKIKITYGGKEYLVNIENLAYEPTQIEQEEKGEHILVKLKTREGKGFATCCIHREHLEKGCMECPTLLAPPRKE